MATIEAPVYPPTAPIPTSSERRGWRDSLAALKRYNYRLYVLSQIVVNTSTWMQRIAVDWLVLELTGSVAAVGLTVAFQFAPILLFSTYAGVLADRWPKRRLLMATQAVTAVLCAGLALLVVTGAAEVGHVYVAALLLGLAAALDQPSRTVFLSEMVPQRDLPGAISLNAAIFHLGGLVGPAVSGLLIAAVGSGWSIGVNAAAALVAVLVLALMRERELTPAPARPRARGQIREAVRYALAKPTIFWPLVMLLSVSLFGMGLPTLLTAFASDVFGGDASAYGLFNSVAAIGAVTGALASARRRSIRLRTIVIGGGVFGFVMMLTAVMPFAWLFAVMLVAVAFTRLLFAIGVDAIIQLSSNLGIRGRVMSLHATVLVGGQAIGGPIIGAIAEHAGARSAMLLAGLLPAVAAIVIAALLARTGHLRLRLGVRRGQRLVSIIAAS